MLHLLAMQRTLVSVAVLVAATVTSAAPRPTTDERLYFALEVHRGGKRLATPRLIGLAGHHVLAERRAPGGLEPLYRVLLTTRPSAEGYDVSLRLDVERAHYERTVPLGHGEERTLRWPDGTEVVVLLMRVDSDEFRALVGDRPGDASL